MRGMFRFLLIIASLAGSSFMAFILIDEKTNSRWWWLTAAYAIGLFLNAGYLLANSRSNGNPSRIGRLVGLWFDAKEAELKKRIDVK